MPKPDQLIVLPSLKAPEYLIEGILPSKEVHLIAGPTGSGKTTWLFQMVQDWGQGKDILGCKSNPVPWVYIAADRKLDSARRTLDRMHMDIRSFPIIPARDKHMGVTGILDEIQASKAKLVIWENFGSYPDAPNLAHQVRNFLYTLDGPIEQLGITIIGVMEETKMKQRDKYENPRQRISGVATWGHLCDTIFVIEPSNLDDPQDPERVLYVCARNVPGMKVSLKFGTDGLLHPNTDRFRLES